MALATSNVDMEVKWSFENIVVVGAAPIKINNGLSLTFTPTKDNSVYNRLYRKTFSLATTATQLIDLASFTDDYNAGAAVVLTRACAIIITGTQDFRFEPNAAANPLPWFFGIAANYTTWLANGGFCAFKEVTFTTGSKLLLTNSGAGTGVFQVAIIGGT